MGRYNRERFKVITIGIDIHRTLLALKRNAESFSDVIRRLAKGVRLNEDLSFSYIRPVEPKVQSFYRSGLFE